MTPGPLEELRVKGGITFSLQEAEAVQGLKLFGPNLEHAIAGSEVQKIR